MAFYNPYIQPGAAGPYGFPSYGTPGVPMMPPSVPSGTPYIPGAGMPSPPAMPTIPGQLPAEESYVENILRLNLGKMATIYMTFENNSQWNAKVFRGIVEAAGRDHIIIVDPQTKTRYLLLMVNLDYITFDERLNYTYPFSAPTSVGG